MIYLFFSASFANDKDNYDLGKAYSYLESAMTLRWEDPNDLVQKVTGPPIEAYNYHVECQTLEVSALLLFHLRSKI